MAKFRKTPLVALLAAGLFAVSAQAEESPQLAALTPDGDTQLLPQSKLEKIAAVSVPEVAPLVTHKLLPAYPALAQKARIQGTVYARLLVNEKGQVERVAQIKGHPIFREAVAKVAEQWQFARAISPSKPGSACPSVLKCSR